MKAISLGFFSWFVACAAPQELPKLSPVQDNKAGASLAPRPANIPSHYKQIKGSSVFMEFCDPCKLDECASGRVVDSSGDVVLEAGRNEWLSAEVTNQTLLLVNGGCVHFSRGGANIVPESFHIWDLATGKKLFMNGSGASPHTLHPDGTKVAFDNWRSTEEHIFYWEPDGSKKEFSTSGDGVIVWDLAKNQQSLTVAAIGANEIVYLNGGATMLTLSWGGSIGLEYFIQLWNAKTGQALTQEKILVARDNDPLFVLSDDGKALFVETPQGKQAWDTQTGALQR